MVASDGLWQPLHRKQEPPKKFRNPCVKKDEYLENIWLPNNKFHGLSASGSHHSLLFEKGFQKIAGRD